jgi:sulfonate transport system ATP-binding protein
MSAGIRPDTRSDAGTAVEVRGLRKEFDGRPVLVDLDLALAPGEFIALLGRSGSGKSTLLRILAGLDQPSAGSDGAAGPGDDAIADAVRVHGSVAVAFQEPRLLPWRRVWRNVVLGLRTGDSTQDLRRVADDVLAEVGLTERAQAWPLTLSGGEAQRASLARALVREPQVLLLDEPFGALDALTRLSMHRLVLDLWRRHRPAVLLVTHDVDEALQLADRVLVLDEGRIRTDLRVDIERPRPLEALAPLRRQVLAELGVTDAT